MVEAEEESTSWTEETRAPKFGLKKFPALRLSLIWTIGAVFLLLTHSYEPKTQTMVSWIISRSVVLVFGTLYPAYYSYKAVKTKNVKEYVRWMMYWIVYALYTVVETITDLTLAWFPLYYELKVAFVIWLLSPYTRGASLIYRKCLHPLLSSKEREIDEYIVQAKERSYETMVNFGKQGLSIAATAAVSAAVKGQGAITEKLRSLSMHDLTQISQQDDRGRNQLYQYSSHSANPAVRRSQSTDAADGPEYFYDQEDRSDEDAEPTFSEDEAVTQKGLRRSQSVKITRSKVRKDVRYGSLKIKGKKRPALSSVNYGM
ncbi:receptor expression-enhancing protein 3 [Sphaeramia orbicularis]|uniref:Receptor expression-enhancing protein n=1 Tax=Sphaeramia orbicularis TaxID=375764 RepID=A0A673ATS0_9TELE|nr:receptor expression-enhancing protein 3 [Sphaeramia orbicularis]XP_029977611.1 receptor expression-enhancing protein 3 [Sphaeramia orbicularis]XP_029977612.1 receptor expression-enhancing protein 3 [Sphaeramia orbicularis]XP_029977613.1 receptor expression-enhancing protein 3 [Sphaeramia orbicularis]XP_029977614.1 receptor expression-enhancing protein 3 [Sphaeramia orbicularis]